MRAWQLPLALLAGMLITAPARGLTPEQIIIVVSRTDADGLRLARFYCQQRAVPKENIVALDLAAPAVDQIPWSAYQTQIVQPLRQTLHRKKQESTIRCLLLVGNLPLRMLPDPPTEPEKREANAMIDLVGKKALEVYQQGCRVEQLSNLQSPSRPPEKLEGAIGNWWQAQEYYLDSLSKASAAINNLPADKRRSWTDQIAHIRESLEGYGAQVDPEPRDRTSADFNARHGEWQKQFDAKVKPQIDKKLATSESLRLTTPAERESRLLKVKEARGVLGLIRQLNSDVDELIGGARSSSLDSELALLWRDSYRLTGGQDNPLFGHADKADSEKQPTLLVARLDGFDRVQPIKMIEDAISIEKAGQGIVGKFCIDAQGLPSNDPNFGQDRVLLDVEGWKARPESMPLAKKASLTIMSPTDANPVAFYLGWNPADKFPGGYTVARGSVAVAFNSAAASDLHNARSPLWCNGWLSAGATVIIGSVEPTDARQFFDVPAFAQALLVDGKPLAEAYWSACHQTSWRVLLIGDPLYRPAAKKAAADAKGEKK